MYFRAARQLLSLLALGLLPLLAIAITPKFALFGFDFRIFWHAADSVLNGVSPYPPPHVSDLAGEDKYVYPPLLALLLIPFANVPFGIASVIFWLLSIAAVPATLWLLEIRDWRVFGIVLLWPAVLSGIILVTVSTLITLALALAWRYRARAFICGFACALAIVIKLFALPIVVWLVAARRWRALLWTCIATSLLVVVPWLLIDWRGLAEYRHLLDELAKLQMPKSFSPAALVHSMGLADQAAQFIGIVVASAVGLIAMRVHDERLAFAYAVLATLLLSPVVWLHYFTLLLLPLALLRPSLHGLWALPLLMWPVVNWDSFGNSGGVVWRIATVMTIAVVTVAAAGYMRLTSPKLADPSLNP